MGSMKAVVLFRREARHGLEPVAVVRRPFLDGPVLHGVGHVIGQVDVDLEFFVDRLKIGLIRLFREPVRISFC